MWVIVKYEEQKFLGRVEGIRVEGCDLHERCARVCCLEKPYGVCEPQEFERELDVICYDEFYPSPVKPVWSQIGRKNMLSY